jgi:hypothetical protein
MAFCYGNSVETESRKNHIFLGNDFALHLGTGMACEDSSGRENAGA